MKSDSQIIYFKSKRNKVRLYQGYIEKYHRSSEAAKFEADRLTRLYDAGLAVPRLLSVKDNMLQMEYIPSIPLPDLIGQWETRQNIAVQEAVILGIVQWLADYYRVVDINNTKETRGDINGRNFLFDGEKVWGVDFEEQIYGVKEQDIGRLMAFILTYDPPETQVKKTLTEIFLQKAVQELDVNKLEVYKWRDSELQDIRRRRVSSVQL